MTQSGGHGEEAARPFDSLYGGAQRAVGRVGDSLRPRLEAAIRRAGYSPESDSEQPRWQAGDVVLATSGRVWQRTIHTWRCATTDGTPVDDDVIIRTGIPLIRGGQPVLPPTLRQHAETLRMSARLIETSHPAIAHDLRRVADDLRPTTG